AQPIAIRALDKTHLRPAGGAKGAFSLGGLPAAQAGGRKNNVRSGAREALQRRQDTRRGRMPQIGESRPPDRPHCGPATIPQGCPNAKTSRVKISLTSEKGRCLSL